MEVADCPDGVSAHHTELIDVPVRVVRLVEDGHLDVPVVYRVGVEGPIVVTLLSALLDAPGEHDNRPRIRLPAHPPEVVSGRVEGALGHYELPLGVEPRDKTGVDEVTSLLVIRRLQLHPAVVVRQDVCKPERQITC